MRFTLSSVAVLISALSGPTAAFGQGMPMRPDVAGWQAALSSDHALATEAGAAVLRAGGNAIDAAVTMAGVLSVVRPHMNGVGGDAFVIYREARTGKVYAINGSGGAGSKATPAFFAEKKLTAIPSSGILSVSVPGAVRLWQDVLGRFGTIPLARALAPGIEYASKGYVVSNRLSADIDASRRTLAADPEMARSFLVNGEAPKAGTILKSTDLAATLRAIATQGADALYKGAVASKIVAFIEKEGGLLTAADLAKHTTAWQDAIETTYLGRRVLAFPPNTQGVTLLQQLNLAELADLKTMGLNSAPYIHTLVEGSKLAYADRDRHVADPAFAKVPVEMLISKEHAKELRAKIGERAGSGDRSMASAMIRDGDGDTVYLCVVDKDGNAVSWIQSNFAAFGSGRMVPGTGIVLHNRGSLYSLDPAHPNILVPGKRPYHTLAPSMVLNADGSLYMVIGTPGGDGQTQTITQVLNNVAMFGMTPQQAVEAPRWRSYGTRLGVEPGITVAVRDALTARGHTVAVQEPSADFGGIQAILLLPTGARMVGSDFRREAYGIAW
jgi:gamma-glutamyltranspeptidase/glutathione hydrolase